MENVLGLILYAGTVKSEAVRILLSIAAIFEGWDIATAFLHPYLKSDENLQKINKTLSFKFEKNEKEVVTKYIHNFYTNTNFTNCNI